MNAVGTTQQSQRECGGCVTIRPAVPTEILTVLYILTVSANMVLYMGNHTYVGRQTLISPERPINSRPNGQYVNVSPPPPLFSLYHEGGTQSNLTCKSDARVTVSEFNTERTYR